jgi:BA14K-like protein
MRLPLSAAGVLLGACLVAAPAQTAPLAGALSKNLSTQADGNSLLLQVQTAPVGSPQAGQRGAGGQHVGGGQRGGGQRGGGQRGGGHRGGGYGGGGGGNGAAIAAGAIGALFLGAVIASEAQRQQAISYCAQRYRSFDPNSMTYVGRNGQRYRCP